MQCPQRPFGFKYAKKYILTKLKYISEHILNLFGAFRIQFKHPCDAVCLPKLADDQSYDPN